LNIEAGERLCLIGRNGVGKSTLLKTIAGSVDVDSGSRWVDTGVTIASLAQDLPEVSDESVHDVVAGGMAELLADLRQFELLSHDPNEKALKRLNELQHRIEAVDGWNLQNRIEQVFTRLQLDGD